MIIIPQVLLDEDIRAVKTRGPVQVPVGPMTRARAKRFKEEMNNLVRRVLQQEESVFTTEGIPCGVQLDLSNGFSIPFVASSTYQGSCYMLSNGSRSLSNLKGLGCVPDLVLKTPQTGWEIQQELSGRDAFQL
ncbi:hypothetical protein PanWU01x14_090800 [Parasponia andersonii]|uniref:Uncharacterized protein n=1 Tax=Parasponia andersonii TaxID=3476 RepID=A0A2P5D6X6_PARAD|nr:hypothetical protein PanWU01x14_090800 [Parasponia andersonii]